MKKIIIAATVIVILGLIVWGVNKKPATTAGNEPIKIGAVLSLTSFAAPWGEFGKKGIELAVKEINEKGGIDGRMVEVVIEDDHTDAKDAVSAYTKLISVDKVQGVIGGVFDFTAKPLIPLAETNKITFISPSNFYIPGGFELNDQSFVMLPEFSKVIRELKTYLNSTNVQKLAVVHYTGPFGNEIAKTLDVVMKENGKGGIIDEPYAQIGGNDFRTMIAKLKAQKIDAVFLDMVGDDPLTFLSQAKQLGYKATFISYNGTQDAFVNEKDKSLLEGVVILNWEVSSQDFATRYRAAHGVEPSKSVDKFYDAVYVLAEALAKTNSREAAASYIKKTTFTTPNGRVTFTADHASESVPVEVTIFKGGERVPFKP